MTTLPLKLTMPMLSPPVYKEAERALFLVTTSGAYRFDDVPPEVYRGLMDAPVKQAYFDKHINGQYKGTPAGMY